MPFVVETKEKQIMQSRIPKKSVNIEDFDNQTETKM
jgi:hypothetical protein